MLTVFVAATEASREVNLSFAFTDGAIVIFPLVAIVRLKASALPARSVVHVDATTLAALAQFRHSPRIQAGDISFPAFKSLYQSVFCIFRKSLNEQSKASAKSM